MDIGVVIVTFNRIKELKNAISKYENQLKKPKYIIIVNNNSNDGTKTFLEEWIKKSNEIEKYIVNLNENIGGSGGFYSGLEMASKIDCDWIWVADDDAYPDEDALLNAEIFLDKNINNKKIAAVCGMVVNNNKIDVAHRRRIKKGIIRISEEVVGNDEYNKESFELELFSYVGSIINKEYLKKVGLTEKDYFIYCDDTEHSYRLSKEGKIICIPSVKIIHDAELQEREEINWKSYYAIRNRMMFIEKHFSKKYFIYEYIRNLISIFVRKIKNYRDPYNDLMYSAIQDAKNYKKGIHKIYKPGWKYIR